MGWSKVALGCRVVELEAIESIGLGNKLTTSDSVGQLVDPTQLLVSRNGKSLSFAL